MRDAVRGIAAFTGREEVVTTCDNPLFCSRVVNGHWLEATEFSLAVRPILENSAEEYRLLCSGALVGLAGLPGDAAKTALTDTFARAKKSLDHAASAEYSGVQVRISPYPGFGPECSFWRGPTAAERTGAVISKNSASPKPSID
ncbi:hypothetical protein [Aurantimonas sp. VKM B-3413]|uniref:hypothetical protein n=1 Tax=Aurantimonas sp. VKM B-3413 TaxID=2779401 RepID=UPI001E302953|nr:hypothetical protein [Aurantimonas sp. VKM B-3413]MCB8835842.1 hypothetical protein [Aurantimonas sp. VKM B-3413]